MKLLLRTLRLICNCVNILYLYLCEASSVLIHEEFIPHSSRTSTCLLRLPVQDSHPTFIERPYEFHHPFKGYFLHIHYSSKGYPSPSVTCSLI
jgi:hypothetical protein